MAPDETPRFELVPEAPHCSEKGYTLVLRRKTEIRQGPTTFTAYGQEVIIPLTSTDPKQAFLEAAQRLPPNYREFNDVSVVPQTDDPMSKRALEEALARGVPITSLRDLLRGKF